MMRNSKRKVEKHQAEIAEPEPGPGGPDGAALEKDQENELEPPVDAPAWLKVQLLPHFEKQEKLMMQVYTQIQRMQNDLHLRGMASKPPKPLPGSIGFSGRQILSPSGGTGYNGSTGTSPATLRAGLT